MIVYTSEEPLPNTLSPAVLTIGNFDGVHCGHRSLLRQARALATQIGGFLVVLTFSNHPLDVLRPQARISRLCSLTEKLNRLQQEGVDVVILREFTPSFAAQTAEQFLCQLHTALPFKILMLGHDARIGSDRQGNTPAMQKLTVALGFDLQYVAPFELDGKVVSSTLIRQFMADGDLLTAKKMLVLE